MDQTLIHLRELRNHLTDEIFKALGMSTEGWWRKLLGPLFYTPTPRFSELAANFDQYVARFGFHEAARWILPHFVDDIEVHHVENIPQDGPLLVAANHPGSVDCLAIAASLPRNDIKIIASAIPFLFKLPYTAQHLISTTLNAHERMNVIRSAIRHLQEGGALLIFPSGNIDPDPAILPGAEDALHRWSRSLEIILSKVPQTRVLPTIVSRVLSPTCLRNPITRLRKELRDRQRLAEFIQVIQQLVLGKRFALIPKITFGNPFTTEELNNGDFPATILQSIIDQTKQLLSRHLSL